jgi:hypothetical protein
MTKARDILGVTSLNCSQERAYRQALKIVSAVYKLPEEATENVLAMTGELTLVEEEDTQKIVFNEIAGEKVNHKNDFVIMINGKY